MVDRYDAPPPFDPEVERVSDEYLERFAFDGLTHLDAASWGHYLPALIDYALRPVHIFRNYRRGTSEARCEAVLRHRE